MMGPVRRKISPHAKALRRNRTEAEERFWLHVRDRRLGRYKFRFQHSIGPYIADFVCLAAAVIIEIDGSQHGEEADAARTRYREANGFTILRFWNNDILQNMDGVLTTVLDACDRRSARR